VVENLLSFLSFLRFPAFLFSSDFDIHPRPFYLLDLYTLNTAQTQNLKQKLVFPKKEAFQTVLRRSAVGRNVEKMRLDLDNNGGKKLGLSNVLLLPVLALGLSN
jgi:hypothetical protein